MKKNDVLWPAVTMALVVGASWAWADEMVWSPRSGHGMVGFKDALVLVGGLEAFESGFFLGDVWTSENGHDWARESLTSPSFSPRQLHTMAVFQDRLWVLGGQSGAELLHDVWHSPDVTNWTQAAASAPWTPRRGMACAVHDGWLYIAGGKSEEHEYLNDVWRSKDGERWELATGAATWGPRAMHALASFKDSLWIIGGVSDYDKYREIWRSADGVSWTKIEYAPPVVAGHHAVVFKDHLYILGGVDKDDRLSNHVYRSKDGVSWNAASDGGADWSARARHAAAVHNQRLWVAGGIAQTDEGGAQETNDVWYTTDGVKWRPSSEQGFLSCLGCDSGCDSGCGAGCREGCDDKDLRKSVRQFLGDWLLIALAALALARFRP